MRYFITLLLLSSSLFLSACGGGADFVGGSDSAGTQGLQTKFSLQDTLNQETSNFLQGEAIKFQLSLTNNSNEEIILRFDSAQQYDFFVKDSVNTEVWRWSSNQLFSQALTVVRVPVAKTIVFSQVWDQIASDGTLLSAGNYTAHGGVLGKDEQSFDLKIQ